MNNDIAIENFEQQELAFYDPAKIVSIAAGRRWGKTQGATNWITETLLDDSGASALWVDTRQANIDKYVQRYFYPLLKPYWYKGMYNAQKKILTLPNDSYIDFGSAQNPEMLEGFGYKYGVVNEAGIVLRNPELWTITLQPMFKGSTAVRLIGTPKGRNQFHKLHTRGKIGDSPDYKSFTFPAYTSPFWTLAELKILKSEVPERVFKQEYLAQFIDNGGVVFRFISQCTKPIQMLQAGIPGRRYVMSADLAKFSDFTVIFVADEQTHEVIYYERFNNIDWQFQKKIIKSISDRFNRATLMMDSTGVGDAIFDDLKSMGVKTIGFKFTNSSKKDLIENLEIGMENKDIFFPYIEVVNDELELFEYELTRSGNVIYSAPDGFHDDTVISLALLYNILREGVRRPRIL